jgi:hypothetical protein
MKSAIDSHIPPPNKASSILPHAPLWYLFTYLALLCLPSLSSSERSVTYSTFILVFWTNSKAMAQMVTRWPPLHVVGLNPRPVCIRFVVEKASIIFQILWICSASTITPICSTWWSHNRTMFNVKATWILDSSQQVNSSLQSYNTVCTHILSSTSTLLTKTVL